MTTTRSCAQCGRELPENARFCGQCGAVVAGNPAGQAAAAVGSAQPVGGRTLLQVTPPQAAPAAALPTPMSTVSAKKTMMGFSGAPDARALAAPSPPLPAGSLNRTMLGISTAQNLQPRTVEPAPPSGRAPGLSANPALAHRTMLGVAIPGIAPLRPGDEAASPPPLIPSTPPPVAEVPIVPPPAPLADLPAPPRPRIVRRRGAPLAAVALVAGGFVIVGGVAIAYLYGSVPPITVQPRVSPDGKDVLHLTCDVRSCKDGTVVDVGGTQATFASGECDLALASPLGVGENPFALRIDRPGMGRDEVLKLSVPVAYRVRADISTMTGDHPAVTIRVQALAGSEVVVDGKPLALDAQGLGAYALDESTATAGPADESRVVSADVPYVVTPPGRPAENGTVSARVAVAPLRVDAPGPRAVVEEDHLLVAGRAAKGAQVTVGGTAVTVGADGAFETSVPLPDMGERTLDVRSGTSVLTPRVVEVAVKRVAHLADEARAFEKQRLVGYDAVEKDVTASVGQPIVVDGEVIESRGSGHRTLVLVDDHRGCAKGPCKIRVIIGKDMALAPGIGIRAYGRVGRAVAAPSGETVPEVDADFALRPRR